MQSGMPQDSSAALDARMACRSRRHAMMLGRADFISGQTHGYRAAPCAEDDTARHDMSTATGIAAGRRDARQQPAYHLR